jgi:hypothetical protein
MIFLPGFLTVDIEYLLNPKVFFPILFAIPKHVDERGKAGPCDE